MALLNLRNITSLRNLIFILIVFVEILGASRVHATSFTDSVLVGGTGPADSKAQLDVKSTSRGVLLPRMTTTQQNAIASPTEGLLIYDNVLHQLSNFNGTTWTAVGGTPAAATTSTLGTVKALGAVSHQFLTGITSGTGVPTQAQPAFTDISGSVAASQLPNPSASTLGGVESLTAVSHNFLTGITTSGVPTQAQPSCADLSNAANSCSTAAASTNTVSNIVLRDGSGNFAAGTITAALTGTASGNLTATPSNHGLLVSSATNTSTVLSVGAAGTVLTGQAGADPSFSPQPTLGVSGTNTGALSLAGSTSGAVTIKPQPAAGSWEFDLPITAGSAGSVLTSQGGAGAAMTWSAALTNPMTTGGDLIVGGAGGSSTRLANGTLAQVLTSQGGTSAPAWVSLVYSTYNFILNSAFDFWQAGTSVTIANGVSTYLADQWYVKNSLGTNGVITFSQVAAVTNGSGFGASVKITTAPTALQTNGTELYQPLSNFASKSLYGQTASFQILVKALGNVNQIGCQFYYATSETKLTTAIGSEQTASVNSSTFSSCLITGQALGTAQTAAGIVGVRIRVTGVSTGNLYDLNNGFVVEQGMLNLGPTYAATFTRQNLDSDAELLACQFFYEKTFDLGTAPAQNVGSASSLLVGFGTVTNTGFISSWQFKAVKRATPTITTYSPNAASANWSTNVTTPVAAVIQISLSGVSITGTTNVTVGSGYSLHAVADARM